MTEIAAPHWELVDQLAEINPEPAYPLAFEGAAEEQMEDVRGMLVLLFGRLPPFARRPFLRSFHGRLYALPLERSLEAVFASTATADGPAPRAAWQRGLEWLRTLPRVLAMALPIPWRMHAIERSAAAAFAAVEAEMARHPLDRLPELAARELVRYGVDVGGSPAFDRAWRHTRRLNCYGGIVGEALSGLLRDALRDWFQDDGRLFLELASGVGEVRSAQTPLAVLELAQVARREPQVVRWLQETPGRGLEDWGERPEAREFRAAFETFLALHGHRGFQEGGGLAPRWAESPGVVLDLVRNLLRADAAHAQATERAGRSMPERPRLGALGRRRPLRRALAGWLARRLHAAARIRENSKWLLVAHSFRLRRTALEAGRRLGLTSAEGEADDAVLFLSRAELEAALEERLARHELLARVAARRAERQRWRTEPPVRALDAHGQPLEPADPPPTPGSLADGDAHGVGASPGIASGPVRVIREPELELDFEPGSVLVAPYTDTAWTPLFTVAAAVVVESGSVLAHAAIVARELGVPCVVRVPAATERWKDGEQVEVDGTLGVVRRVSGAAQAV